MAELFEILRDLLCYGNYECANTFNQYAYKPIEGLFFTVFFPILYIMIFVYIVSGAIGLNNKGFRVLIGVGLFAFIILQGYYNIFLIISKLWMFSLLLLGFLWFFIHTFTKGSAKGRTGSGEGLMGKAMSRVMHDVKGDTRRLESQIERAIAGVDIIVKSLERGDKDAWRMAADAIKRLEDLRNELVEMMKGPGGFVVGDFSKWESKIDASIKRLQHIQDKAVKK